MNDAPSTDAYGDAEQLPGTPTLAQWARAAAMQAIASSGDWPTTDEELVDRTNILAEAIITGSLPD